MTFRVLLADDQDLVRAGFRMILEAREDVEVVAEACDGAQAVDLARRLGPDVVVMDIRMPVMDGISATAQIAAACPRTKVLILTTFDTDDHVYDAIRAGASGFLLKDTRADQFVDAIQAVALGDAIIAPATTRRLLEHIARTAPQPQAQSHQGSPHDVLTERECEVLLHIAHGLANHEIAATMFLSESTVKTHIAAIMRKLNLRDRVHAVITAYDHGLVRPGSGPPRPHEPRRP